MSPASPGFNRRFPSISIPCNLHCVTFHVFSAHRKESQTEAPPRSVNGFHVLPLSFAFSSILLLAAAETLFLGECAYCTSVFECVSVHLCVGHGCGCVLSTSFKNSHAAFAHMVLKDQLTLAWLLTHSFIKNSPICCSLIGSASPQRKKVVLNTFAWFLLITLFLTH